jgi:hypothetical protein
MKGHIAPLVAIDMAGNCHLIYYLDFNFSQQFTWKVSAILQLKNLVDSNLCLDIFTLLETASDLAENLFLKKLL